MPRSRRRCFVSLLFDRSSGASFATFVPEPDNTSWRRLSNWLFVGRGRNGVMLSSRFLMLLFTGMADCHGMLADGSNILTNIGELLAQLANLDKGLPADTMSLCHLSRLQFIPQIAIDLLQSTHGTEQHAHIATHQIRPLNRHYTPIYQAHQPDKPSARIPA